MFVTSLAHHKTDRVLRPSRRAQHLRHGFGGGQLGASHLNGENISRTRKREKSIAAGTEQTSVA